MLCKNQVVGKLPSGKLYLHPCGQCLPCRINDMRSWYVRTFFEIKKPERPFQYFLTLTYNDENLPPDGLCKKDHLKKFLNNLNTSFGLSMRYFATADYGDESDRPHYHAILLSTKKIQLNQCERIWKKGFCYLKKSTDFRIRYTIRYTIKKRVMSYDEPGFFRLISKGWGDNFMQYYNPNIPYLLIEGKKYGVPDYYKRKFNLDIDKKPLRTYFDYRDFIFSKDFDKKTDFEGYKKQMQELINVRRRLK